MPRPKPLVPDLTQRAAQAPVPLDWIAGAFSFVWVVGVGVYVWSGLSPSGVIGMLMTTLVVALPLALCWYAVAGLKSIAALRAEAAQLRASMDQLRTSYASNKQQALAANALRPTAGDEPSVAFSSRRDASLTQPSADRRSAMAAPARPLTTEEQPGLALGTPLDDSVPLEVADFLRAIHFPESPEDAAGFRALRLALADRVTAKLIRAAQDVLTLLAQEGIFMDDLDPDRPRPELWRKFAAGERGRAIAGLGGVRDRSCLALTAARMREDAVFRDAAHHFLRSFDKAVAAIEPRASDSDLSILSDTRTARAFMLFGRVTGTFD